MKIFKNMVRQITNKHDFYLDNLITNLDTVGECLFDIKWIGKNIDWFEEGTLRKYKLCDLINIYYDNSVSCIELKSSRSKRWRALKQLESSEEFVKYVLNYSDITKKFVYYNKGNYRYEIIP